MSKRCVDFQISGSTSSSCDSIPALQQEGSVYNEKNTLDEVLAAKCEQNIEM